jgi:hypothetical protein
MGKEMNDVEGARTMTDEQETNNAFARDCAESALKDLGEMR